MVLNKFKSERHDNVLTVSCCSCCHDNVLMVSCCSCCLVVIAIVSLTCVAVAMYLYVSACMCFIIFCSLILHRFALPFEVFSFLPTSMMGACVVCAETTLDWSQTIFAAIIEVGRYMHLKSHQHFTHAHYAHTLSAQDLTLKSL